IRLGAAIDPGVISLAGDAGSGVLGGLLRGGFVRGRTLLGLGFMRGLVRGRRRGGRGGGGRGFFGGQGGWGGWGRRGGGAGGRGAHAGEEGKESSPEMHGRVQ